jgi:hypothetical protein
MECREVPERGGTQEICDELARSSLALNESDSETASELGSLKGLGFSRAMKPAE